VILLVEDDVDVREMMRLVLEGRGYAVREASNGLEALELLRQDRPQLMILDLIMPVMDGWALLDEMKAEALTDVPVCVVSAVPERGPRDVAATLRKPFELPELVALLERYCPLPPRDAASPPARG